MSLDTQTTESTQNAAPSIMTDEQVLAMVASGGAAPTEEEQEPAVDDTAEETESPDAGEEADDGEGDSPDDEAAVATEEAEPKEKPRSKYIPRTRFDEVVTQNADLKRRDTEKDFALREEQRKNAELVSLIKEKFLGKPAPAAEEDEVLDTALEAKITPEIEAVKRQLVQMELQNAIVAADTLGQQHLPDYDTAKNFWVAKEAEQLIIRAAAFGHKATREEAIRAAYQVINSEIEGVWQGSRDAGRIASYAYSKAQAYGFKPQTENTKPSDTKPKVNMKAVEKNRQEAGAPAIAKASVKVSGNNWKDDIAHDYRKKHGDGSDDYLRMMGVL